MNPRPKRPRDPAQLAKLMIDIASGEVEDIATNAQRDKNPAAVALGRLGGKRGGAARAAKLSSRRKREIAKKAAAKRWAAKAERE